MTRDFVSFQLVNKNGKLQGMLLLLDIQKFKESITAVEDLEAGFTEDVKSFLGLLLAFFFDELFSVWILSCFCAHQDRVDILKFEEKCEGIYREVCQ